MNLHKAKQQGISLDGGAFEARLPALKLALSIIDQSSMTTLLFGFCLYKKKTRKENLFWLQQKMPDGCSWLAACEFLQPVSALWPRFASELSNPELFRSAVMSNCSRFAGNRRLKWKLKTHLGPSVILKRPEKTICLESLQRFCVFNALCDNHERARKHTHVHAHRATPWPDEFLMFALCSPGH